MLSARRVVEAIKERAWPEGDVLVALWCQVVTGREAFAQEVRELRGAAPIVPLVPRTGTFGSPNALLSDLGDLIERSRDLFSECADVISTSDEPFVILLLCRTPFNLPRIASPMLLPAWFPRKGGQTIYVPVQDFESTGEGPLSSPESRIEDIARLVYEIDRALLRRLVTVHQSDCQLLQGLLSDVLQPGEQWEAFSESCRTFLDSVKNPQGYRPSLRQNRSMVSRLLRVVAQTPIASLGSLAGHLATALDLDAQMLTAATRETLVAVLVRPPSPITDAPRRGIRAVLVTLYAAFQLTTAAAHSDDYPKYSLYLLRCASRDIRAGLDCFVSALA